MLFLAEDAGWIVCYNIFDNPRENLFFNLASVSAGFFSVFFPPHTSGVQNGNNQRMKKKGRINSFQMPTCSYPSSPLISRCPYMHFLLFTSLGRCPRSIRVLISRRVSAHLCTGFAFFFSSFRVPSLILKAVFSNARRLAGQIDLCFPSLGTETLFRRAAILFRRCIFFHPLTIIPIHYIYIYIYFFSLHILTCTLKLD